MSGDPWFPITSAPVGRPILVWDGREQYMASREEWTTPSGTHSFWRTFGAGGPEWDNAFSESNLVLWRERPANPGGQTKTLAEQNKLLCARVLELEEALAPFQILDSSLKDPQS